jgi:hypothetical protein
MGVDLPSIPKPAPWWESKTALLALGFVLTGVIGPWLQYVQKTLDVRRQTAFDLYSRQLTAMKETRKEIGELHIGMAALTEHLDDLTLPAPGDAASARWAQDLLEGNVMTRIREYAKVSIMLDDFHDVPIIQAQLDECNVAWKAVGDCIRTLQRTKDKAERERLMKTVHDAKIKFNDGYTKMRDLMEGQIGEFIDAHR